MDAVRQAYLGHYSSGAFAVGAAVTVAFAAVSLVGGARLFSRG